MIKNRSVRSRPHEILNRLKTEPEIAFFFMLLPFKCIARKKSRYECVFFVIVIHILGFKQQQ